MEAEYTLERGVELLDLPTAGDVAQVLRAAGATALSHLNRASGCPVAVFLTGYLGEQVTVGPSRATDGDVLAELPTSAQLFIRRFDDGDPEFMDLDPGRNPS